jgi:hypothetical protein
VEVLLRNASDAEVRDAKGSDWYNTIEVVQPERKLLEDAIVKVTDGVEYRLDEDDVVASLSFGFWRGLLDRRRYQSRFWPVLTDAFKYMPAGRTPNHADFEESVTILNQLRNDVSHHELIFDQPLELSIKHLNPVASAICPKTQKWMAARSRVEDLLRNADPRAIRRG